MSRRVLILNGPNLGRLGSREPDVYGRLDYQTLVQRCVDFAAGLGLGADVRQTDSEEVLLSWLAEAETSGLPVILNPAAFTHYSYPLAEACRALTVPLIEVHISNPHAREPFRSRSVVSRHAVGTIAGFGVGSYLLALTALRDLLGE